MKKQAIIYSCDFRFKRMLELELWGLGIDIIDDINEAEESLHVLLDLDCEIPKEFYLIEKLSVIGFSKRSKSELVDSISLCDEYLQRPFFIRELFALLGFNQQEKVVKHQSPKRNDDGSKRLTLDSDNKAALYGDTVIPLSDNEFAVLSFLCKRRGQTVERNELDELLGSAGSNMGDVYICHLRKKIDNHLGLKLI